jgi:hypothetical protein
LGQNVVRDRVEMVDDFWCSFWHLVVKQVQKTIVWRAWGDIFLIKMTSVTCCGCLI